MKKIIVALTLFLMCLFSVTAAGYVVIYPGVYFYGGNLTLSFQSETNISYLEVDSNYFVIDSLNLSMVCTSGIDINVSEVNSSINLTSGTSVLRFNATYTTGSVTFTFTGNHTNSIYKLYTDSVLTSTHEVSSFSWSYISWSEHDFDIRLDGYRPDPPYNPGNDYDAVNNAVNLTWTSGNYSDVEVLLKKTTGYPSSPTDGTIVQNSSTPYYNFTISEDAYYTVWSYNETGIFSSTGLDLPWGALTLNVFNASKTWQNIDPFGIIIQNVDGTQIYRNTTVTPPLYLNLSDIPIGSNTVFIINASDYKIQTYSRDTAVNTFMNYTFLLSPVETTTPGEGDTDPVTGDPTNYTDSQLYLITLLNEVDQSLPDGLITFSLYVNSTDTYEQIGSFITDGAGQGTIWLVPNKLYKIVCSVPSSTDYQTSTSYWTPSSLLLTKTFKLKYTEDDIQPAKIPQDYITFTATRTNTSMTIVYDDTLSETINTTIYVYEINITTGTETLFHTNTTTGVNSFTLTVDGLTANNSYRISLKYNHTTFGEQDPTIILAGYRVTITAPETFNVMMTNIFGYCPLVWSHVIMFLILVAGMFYADSEDAGKVLIILGGLFIFINTFIGFDDALTMAAGGIIPGLFIIIGVLVEWNSRKV